MEERERTLMQARYELQLKLLQVRGEEIAALRKATEALQEYHDALGRLFRRP